MRLEDLRVKEPAPAKSSDYSTIEAALRSGAKLHAFLSGGGLRVVRLEQDDKLLGYGEHPHLSNAFEYCEEDTKAGGRPYGEVYGKLHDLYVTGSTTTNDELDAWIRRGRSFDVTVRDGVTEAVLHGYQDNEAPAGFQERAMKGETLTWTSRGYTYRISPYHFPNGEPGSSTVVIESPKDKRHGADSSMWPITQTATGSTLLEALLAALKAPPVEVARDT